MNNKDVMGNFRGMGGFEMRTETSVGLAIPPLALNFELGPSAFQS